MRRIPGLLICMMMFATSLPAEDWRHISRNATHKVYLDRDSIRLANGDMTSVALKFEPIGRKEMKTAAMGFGVRGYAYHIERFEISCSGDAIHRTLDLFAADGRTLGSQNVSEQLEEIMPGTSLAFAAAFVCPESDHDEDVADNESAEDAAHADGGAPELLGRPLEEAVARTAASPDDAGAWIHLGNLYYDAGNAEKAIESYAKALALNPENSDVLNDQGAMLRQAGRYEDAVGNFEKTLRLDPLNLEALYNLGYVNAYDLNRPEKAREAWSRYLELDRTSENSRTVRTMMERLTKTPLQNAEKNQP